MVIAPATFAFIIHPIVPKRDVRSKLQLLDKILNGGLTVAEQLDIPVTRGVFHTGESDQS